MSDWDSLSNDEKYQAHCQHKSEMLDASWERYRQDAINAAYPWPMGSRVLAEAVFDEIIREQSAWMAVLPSPHGV